MSAQKAYLAIDLKSFYASVECHERGLDPLKTNLVVADPDRTEKTICLAVSPSLRSFGIPARARLFEVIQKVREVNRQRRLLAPGRTFTGKSANIDALGRNPSLALDYIVAVPRMACYMEYSTRIVDIYLKYVSFDDMHIYSVDEVFIDATAYLGTYRMTAHDLAMRMIRDVLLTTGITATVGIGTNLYLAKIAMDIVAKRMPADSDGVRIAELDERRYREQLWTHRPLTDFWRIGRRYAAKLEARNLFTMGDIAACSLRNEDLLYKLFGVNAELLIDHAWGWEPCEIRHIKDYRPESNSLSVGQVLPTPYSFENGKIILREMAGGLSLDLFKKRLLTDQIVLSVCYDISNVTGDFHGETEVDAYGRKVPKSVHGSENLGGRTSSTAQITGAALRLYERIADPALYIRRVYVVANHVVSDAVLKLPSMEQLNLFTDAEAISREREAKAQRLKREQQLQKAMLTIQERYGKNAILFGTSYREGATGRERNKTVGGHKA